MLHFISWPALFSFTFANWLWPNLYKLNRRETWFPLNKKSSRVSYSYTNYVLIPSYQAYL